MRLKDKVAIITGGAQGIGRAFSLGYAAEGAKIVLADINVPAANILADELKKQGTESLVVKTDVSSAVDTEELAKKTIEKFNRIDILVNNAAVYSRVKISRVPLHQLSQEEWDRVMAVNVRGVFLCCKAVLPQMMKQKSGKIINIASALAFFGIPNASHYIASKGAVVSLSRALSKEVGDYNINVNSICPGSTLSEELTEQAMEFRKKETQMRAIKRLEYPEDLVGAAIFLASGDSDFITGQAVVVDGGAVQH